MIDALILLACVFLFSIFISAGIGKLIDIEGSKKSLKEMGFSNKQIPFLAFTLPIVEIITGIGFLINGLMWFSAAIATILLLSFSIFTAYQIKRGSSADCHCFGAIHSELISPKVIIRNLLFIFVSIFLLFQREKLQNFSFAKLPFELSLYIIFGLLTIGLLILISYYLKENINKQNQILRRLEILSLTTKADEEILETQNIKNPTEGLPIGTPVPHFQVKDNKGDIVDSFSILQKPSVLFFTAPNCELCNLIFPEIESWKEKMKEKFEFIFISNGGVIENSEKLDRFFVQKEHEISDLFKTRWIPTAIFINRNKRVASAPAVGDKAILSMLKYLASNGEVDFIPEGNTEKDGKIGSIVPEFTAEDINGNVFHSKQFIGRKTLLTYWSPNCGFCKEMLEELKEWEKSRKPYEPTLVILSASAEIEKNRSLQFQAPILIDKNRAIAEMLGMKGTPSAILIDENARIISQIAIGAEQIWALLGKAKK